MRHLLSSLACVGLSLACAARAEAPAQRSTDDFVKAIQTAPCANNEPRDEDGLCPAVTGGQKGFSLFAPSSEPRTAKSASPTSPHPARMASAPSPRHAPMIAPRRTGGALSDLKITFKLGSAELTDEGKATADNFAKALRQLPQTRFEIAGYTDVSGAPDRNRALSQARAEAVKSYLVAAGIDGSRLQSKGYGSDDLAVPSSPTSGANRRVEAHNLN